MARRYFPCKSVPNQQPNSTQDEFKSSDNVLQICTYLSNLEDRKKFGR